jgi:Tol biopolymer transport system component
LSPDGRYIAYDVFERINGIDRDIYVIAADGRSEAALVKNPGSDSCPLWTPDGRHIVFTSTRTGSNSLWSIAVLNGKAEGTPQLLKPDVGRIFPRGFVRSGTLYYSQDKADENIYLANMDAATGRLRGGIAPITDTYVGLNRSVAFSPDGKRVAYLSNRAHVRFGPGAFTVVIRTLDTGEERAYSTDLGLTPRVVWFPDGRRLLLPARDAKSGVSLYSLDVNSGDVRLIVKPEQPINPNVNIGRDGRTALVTAVDQASRIASLDALDLQTGERKTLYKTPGRGFINGVSVSPDGGTLAIIMNSGVGPKSIARIGTMPLNGGEFRELVIETNADDIRPYAGIAWSPDGRYLYYARVLKREDFQLWRIRATGGTPEPTGVQGRQVRQMSVAADGRIAFTAGQPNESEIWALDNLLPTLKASR